MGHLYHGYVSHNQRVFGMSWRLTKKPLERSICFPAWYRRCVWKWGTSQNAILFLWEITIWTTDVVSRQRHIFKFLHIVSDFLWFPPWFHSLYPVGNIRFTSPRWAGSIPYFGVFLLVVACRRGETLLAECAKACGLCPVLLPVTAKACGAGDVQPSCEMCVALEAQQNYKSLYIYIHHIYIYAHMISSINMHKPYPMPSSNEL